MSPLIPNEDENVGGSLVLDFRKVMTARENDLFKRREETLLRKHFVSMSHKTKQFCNINEFLFPRAFSDRPPFVSYQVIRLQDLHCSFTCVTQCQSRPGTSLFPPLQNGGQTWKTCCEQHCVFAVRYAGEVPTVY